MISWNNVSINGNEKLQQLVILAYVIFETQDGNGWYPSTTTTQVATINRYRRIESERVTEEWGDCSLLMVHIVPPASTCRNVRILDNWGGFLTVSDYVKEYYSSYFPNVVPA